MQSSITRTETSMKALLIRDGHLSDIETLMPRLQASIGPNEVVEIANINSASQIVLSGTENGVQYAASVFHSKGFSGRALALPVSAPFHCSLMVPAAEILHPALDKIKFKVPKIKVISNVTAKPVF
jgi:[acyl-carrier-protein] S-malonyltransferase